MESLGTTRGGRDILLVTVSDNHEAGAEAKKPAILVLGSVDAESLVGCWLALEMIADLAGSRLDTGNASSALKDVTFYFIPRPSPDASERAFQEPLVSTAVNERPTDDDRDGQIDEDPPEDLNGDGMITAMRIADPAGEYLLHPDDPRVLIKADPTKGEHGKYRLLIEGVDNDRDKLWNEDGPGGVDFNRNFTFRYPYFEPGAGPHQMSEVESRVVADFAFNHPNIFLVFSIADADNLNHPWKGGAGGGRIKRSPQGEDAKYYQRFAEEYRELIDHKDAPSVPKAESEGAFAPWAYYHYGRWSLAARGWWPEKIDAPPSSSEQSDSEQDESAEAQEPTDAAEDEGGQPASGSSNQPAADEEAGGDMKNSGGKASTEKRGSDELRTLRWFEAKDIDAFADWTRIDHPDFPGKVVEVGGFMPFVRRHPPVGELDAAPLLELLTGIADERAKLSILDTVTEELGENVVRITARVVNRGSLPTASKMGEIAGKLQRAMVQLSGPGKMEVLVGPRRQDLSVLAPGEVVEKTWLVRLPADSSLADLKLRAGEPSIGFVESSVTSSSAGEPNP
ncbi:MAG: M14 family metallopeptidase [Planctomycetota bacterium]